MTPESQPRWPDWLSWLIPILLIVLAIASWEIAVRLRDTPRWFLPPPSAVLTALIDSRRTLLHHTVVTLEEVALGFGLSFVLGVAFALAIASSRVVERAFYPFVVASQAIPIIALAPILLIWFGYGMTPKVIVVALICFFPIVVNTVDGLRSVDPELIDLLRSMGASSLDDLSRRAPPVFAPISLFRNAYRRGGERHRGTHR